jgi:UDP-2,4-diacetamido-2,4,6-trideoxy-beta-L-altropyranose hydrolase
LTKKLIFRADGNDKTGLGHLYRLFAFIEMVKDTYNYTFVTRSTSTTQIIPEEYPLMLISEDIDHLEEPQWISEGFSPKESIIIIDGYHFKTPYQKKLKELGFSIIYIDDLEKYHMYADIVINHSGAALKSKYLAESYTKFSLGVQYALLRPKFLNEAKSIREIDEIDTVFVCFGGADEFNFSYKASKALLEIDYIKEIKLVVGAAYKHDEIWDLKKMYPERLKIYKNLSEVDLLGVMKSCNLAISPTSTILYELTCVKMPIISGYFVENQKSVYKWFKEQECFYGVDDFVHFNFKELANILFQINKSYIKKYMYNQHKVIDGYQKSRLLGLITQL